MSLVLFAFCVYRLFLCVSDEGLFDFDETIKIVRSCFVADLVFAQAILHVLRLLWTKQSLDSVSFLFCCSLYNSSDGSTTRHNENGIDSRSRHRKMSPNNHVMNFWQATSDCVPCLRKNQRHFGQFWTQKPTRKMFVSENYDDINVTWINIDLIYTYVQHGCSLKTMRLW